MSIERTLPFPALVGLDAARQALLLLAVDPRLGGVVLAAGVGTGKSSLMRSFARLLALEATMIEPEQVPHGSQPVFVELPVGVTEDRLLGGLDLEATLATGQRVLRSGLLARAHGGLLYADGVNLLEDSTINHMLAALDTGVVRVERDGLSLVELAQFGLLATYDPAEGPPRRHLLDRVGLIVAPITRAPVTERIEVVRRNQLLTANGCMAERLTDWIEEEQVLWALIMAARELLPTVQIDDAQIEQLAGTALALGVEGHRADIFATRAALASAALAGRDQVEHEDIERAVRYVLLPRATRLPQMAEEPQDTPEPPPPDPSQTPEQQHQDENEPEQPPEPPQELMAIEDLVLSALEARFLPMCWKHRSPSGDAGGAVHAEPLPANGAGIFAR